MQFLRTIDAGLEVVFNVLILLSSVFMTGLVFFLVLSRYFFGSSMIGTLEMATICALWLYMLGCIMASKRTEHLTVDIVETSIKNPMTIALYETSRSLIVFGLSVFVLFLAKDMLDWSLRRPQITPALGLPLMLQQASMLIAAVFFVIYGLRDIFRALALFQNQQGSA